MNVKSFVIIFLEKFLFLALLMVKKLPFRILFVQNATKNLTRKLLLLVTSSLIFISNNLLAQQKKLTDFVNPMIGTGGHGHTFPGATVPFGMMQLSPDTRLDGWDGCSGYHYTDSIIYGFSHTHLSGTGCSDYGDILLMPCNKRIVPTNKNYASTFSHQTEKASAGFYEVYLNKPQVKVQLTTTARCGMHQYMFAKGDEQFVALDLQHRDEVIDSELEIVYPNKIRGYRFSKAWANNQKVFFEIEFNKPFKDITFYNNDSLCKKTNLHSKNIKALFEFENSNKPLLAKVAISGVDKEGALKNLETEMPDFNFEKYKKKAQQTWEKELAVITLKSENSISTEEKIKFYSALYHCFIQPNIYNDIDNRYRGMDDKIHSTKGAFNYYSVFSIWDTYRAWHPLMTIVDAKRCNDFIQTFLAQYDAIGKLPIWELSSNETNCMIGNHAASIIWDAWSKGIHNFELQKAYTACKAMATSNKDDIQSIMKYGYVRADDDAESVSKTLELAYDDWCLAQLGNVLIIKNNIQILKSKSQLDSLAIMINTWDNYYDTSIVLQKENLITNHFNDSISNEKLKEEVAIFLARSNNWKNVFDPTTGFMRALKNSTFYTPFSPYTVDNNYTEANSWQYSFYVPHDIAGLIRLHGGQKKFTQKLNDLFAAKTQTEGREQADITGLIGQYAHGNEPSHHITYLYNYSLEPNKRKDIIHSIMQEMYTTNPDGYIGNEDCGQMSAWYVMSAIGLYQIAPGSTKYEYDASKFQLWNLPPKPAIVQDESDLFNTMHAIHRQPLLGNFSTTFIANPFIIDASQIFKDSLLIKMQCTEKDAYIFYSINNEEQKMYMHPITIYNKSNIHFYSAKDDRKSPTQEATFYKIPNDRIIKINSVYNKSYSGGGPEALIDGLFGDVNWRKGNWQGYQSQDFEAVIEFAMNKKCKRIAANFLQDQKSWIFFPSNVEYYGSVDGKTYELLSTNDVTVPRDDEKNSLLKMNYTLTLSQATKAYKSFKVIAKNYGTLPTWHPGAGGDAFIFVDEVEVE
jgi:putative alpha-1,2-mannosidase